MKTLNIGIIGAGRIGKVHAQSITYHIPQAKVVHISDVHIESAKEVAELYNIETYSSSFEEVIHNPKVDAILICSPTNTHADIAILAAKAGKHVFCEKPVDMTVEKILDTKKAVEAAGIKFQVGFNRRFDHNHSKVQQVVENGDLGKVEIVKITSRDPEPPSPEYAASSGGLYLDMMIHDFDMAMFQANSDVVEVYAKGTCLVDPAIGKAGDVDTAIVVLTFANGAIGVIDNSRRAAYGYDQRVEVFGEKGMALNDNDSDSNVKISTVKGVEGEKPQFFFLERYMDSFVTEMKAFVDAVVNNKTVPVGIHEGLMSVVIAKAAQKSSDENRPVKISEILEG